jgi:hypothetical protein
MNSRTATRRQRDTYFWPDGASRKDMLRALSVLGIDAAPGMPFPCVLPGHGGHDAVVCADTFAYRCVGGCAIYARRTTPV